MPREIPYQLISGSPYTERECLARLIDELGNARDSARGMAQLRKDMRWQMIAGKLQQIQDIARALINQRSIPLQAIRRPQ